MKTLFEIYRILRELGIKTKDIIGVGKSMEKTGTKLFKELIDPKILNVIYEKGKLSDKIKRIITEAAKNLRNTNVIEQNKFLVNIKKIKNSVFPQEADVIDIATRAKIPDSGIKKLIDRNKKLIDKDKEWMADTFTDKGVKFTGRNLELEAFKTGEARWILNKALKEDLFSFKPEEIKMIKGGRGDIIELFRKYYGSNAVRNLPSDGEVASASKFFDELKWAVDENGLFANHVDFNKEAINWKLTRELVKDYSKKLDDHPFQTFTELKAKMPLAPVKVEGPFPRLSPENDAFIILDDVGTTVGRYEGRVAADEVTGKSVTRWYDRWDAKNKKLLTDQSKYKFSGAVDDKGEDIIEGVIEGGKSTDLKETIIKKYKGVIDDDLLNKILADDNPQRIAEVMATMDEALIMQKKGMSPEGIMKALKDAWNRPKQATGGRIGLRTGTPKEIINLVVKHGPAFKKFADGLFIKASNAIRLGQGIFKNLTQSQKIKQHDNLVKAITTFEKKGTLEGTEQYFGINAEKAFIEAQASVTKSPLKEVSKTRTMDDLVEDAYKEVFHQPAFARSGDYKYDADILATEIASQGGKIYDDLADVEKAGIYDLAYKRVIKDLKTRMDFEKNLKDVEQKIELQMFDPKGKTKHATGGRIGYSDGTILPEPKPDDVYLDEKLKKLQDAKKTILDNPGAFDDNGAALLQSINNDIAELRKRYFDIEEIPGHATGGVSNLFRRR